MNSKKVEGKKYTRIFVFWRLCKITLIDTHLIDGRTLTLYFIHMRTNIELNDRLIQRARKLTGLKTKKAIVDEALRTLIRMYQQRKVRGLRGKLEWQGDLNHMREKRLADTR